MNYRNTEQVHQHLLKINVWSLQVCCVLNSLLLDYDSITFILYMHVHVWGPT